MKSLKKYLLIPLALAFSTTASAEFREIGSSLNVVRLGNPQKCLYRAVFREPYGSRGAIRIPLPQSSFYRSSSTSLPSSNHVRGKFDAETFDEIIDLKLLSPEEWVGALGLNSGGGNFLSGTLSLVETGEGVVYDMEISIIREGSRQTTGIRLPNGSVGIEEECSSRLARALVRRR